MEFPWNFLIVKFKLIDWFYDWLTSNPISLKILKTIQLELSIWSNKQEFGCCRSWFAASISIQGSNCEHPANMNQNKEIFSEGFFILLLYLCMLFFCILGPILLRYLFKWYISRCEVVNFCFSVSIVHNLVSRSLHNGRE